MKTPQPSQANIFAIQIIQYRGDNFEIIIFDIRSNLNLC